MEKIQFIDLAKQQQRIRKEIDSAIARVLDKGAYIMGPEIAQFEKDVAEFTDTSHAISCSSGTDALSLALMALDVKPNDAVLLPSFTFAATAETVALLGAHPVFVDVEADTFNMSLADLERAHTEAKNKNLNIKGIIAVDLFGQPADYDAIEQFASQNGLWVLADAAQSLGGSYNGRKVGQFGICTATSFFPAKPLGCYGDGGCVFTEDAKLAAKMRSLRVHGKGSDKYDNVNIGLNARLDTIQAAILIEKLKIFAEEIELRNQVAANYSEKLSGVAKTPVVLEGAVSSWAQYTLLLDEHVDRAKIAGLLKEVGIPTAVYYPKPLHQQTAYKKFHEGFQALTNSDMLSGRVISLPMHPYLESAQQDYIIEKVQHILGQ